MSTCCRSHDRQTPRPTAIAHADRHAAGRRACHGRETERRRVRVSVDELQARQWPSVSLRVWRVRWHRVGSAYASTMEKVEIATRESKSFSDDRHIFGEPLFVSRPEGDAEDDGVLLTVGSAQNAESSVLAVIDARTMGPRRQCTGAELDSSRIPLVICAEGSVKRLDRTQGRWRHGVLFRDLRRLHCGRVISASG